MVGNQAKLYAPPEYWKLSKSALEEIVNGCGSAQAKFDFVPDSIWFLDISPACYIHDYMYFVGETLEDKESADRVFLNNMLRLIDAETKWRLLKWLRRKTAKLFYQAVKNFGGPSFWEGKNREEEERLAG